MAWRLSELATGTCAATESREREGAGLIPGTAREAGKASRFLRSTGVIRSHASHPAAGSLGRQAGPLAKRAATARNDSARSDAVETDRRKGSVCRQYHKTPQKPQIPWKRIEGREACAGLALHVPRDLEKLVETDRRKGSVCRACVIANSRGECGVGADRTKGSVCRFCHGLRSAGGAPRSLGSVCRLVGKQERRRETTKPPAR